MSENSNLPKADSEVDLMAAFQKLAAAAGSLFKYCGRLAGVAILFTVRKSLWLLVFLCAGLAVAFMQYSSGKRYYASTLTAHINVLNNAFFVNAFSELQGIAPEVLAGTLQIPDSVAENVRSIAAFYGIDLNMDGQTDLVDYQNQHKKRLTDSMFNIVPREVYVRVEVYDESSFDPLRESVISFINSNKNVVEHNKFRLYRLDQEIADVNAQIRRLDSLQRSEYAKSIKESSLKMGGSQLLLLGEEKDRQLFHEHIFALQSRKLSLESEKTLYATPITVLQDFLPLAKATNTLLFYARKTVPAFMALGLLCALLWQYRKKLWDLVKNKHY
jgi:hypothetical protein